MADMRIIVPEDIKAILDTVNQTRVRASGIPQHILEKTFSDVNDCLRYVSSSAI